MTPDQNKLISEVHLKVGRLPPSAPAPVTAGEVVRLINFLRLNDQALDKADRQRREVLTSQAEFRLDELLGGPTGAINTDA